MATATVLRADAARLPLADQSVDLVFGSPPYTDCRTYDDGTLPEGHVVSRDTGAWVDWMLTVTEEALRVCRGPVLWVVGCPTRDRTYQPAAEGLMWRWWERGGSAYRPCYWHRVGIPGSGGDQWFRADVEYVMCFKRPGPLPWTDNTAMGHPPKCEPGGAMSYRTVDGQRVNGKDKTKDELRALGVLVGGRQSRTKNGERVYRTYVPPEKSNPGCLVQTNAGGGQLGDRMVHENEAPFPEKLAEWFIRSLCPPGGTVLDPFSGSGTTIKVAKSLNRNGIGCDIRTSQVALSKRRVRSVQRELIS